MGNNFIYQAGKAGGVFGDFIGDLLGYFLEFLTRLTISALFRNDYCNPSCEHTVKIWIVIILFWLIAIAGYIIYKAARRRKYPNQRN